MANQSIDDYRKSMQTVLDEAIHLSRLTGQLLDLSGEDHGIARQNEEVQLDAIIQAVIDNLRAEAERKAIRIVVSPIPVGTVYGDPVRLRRVFMNLIDNAIQYTPNAGQIQIDGTLSPEQATLVVTDNGPGIPAEDLPHIFDRFRRVDKARNAQSGGTGLGLAICKSIVEAHGGRIWMESTEGRGTRVGVILPRAKSASAASSG
jgi:signal transduction histidine kinase